MFNENIKLKLFITTLSFILLSLYGCNKNQDITGNNETNDLGNYAGVYKSSTYDINIGSDGAITVAESGSQTITGTVSKKEGNKYTIKLDNGNEIIIEFLDNGSVTITKPDGTTESATKTENNTGGNQGGNTGGNTGGETQSDGKDHKNHSLLICNWKNNAAPAANDRYVYDGEYYTAISSYNPDYSVIMFQIKVEKIIWSSDTAGIMYGQYTKQQEYGGNPQYIEKYYAVSFKDLSESTCSFSGALKGDDYKAETLEEAITKFTIENGYFNSYTTCSKTTDSLIVKP